MHKFMYSKLLLKIKAQQRSTRNLVHFQLLTELSINSTNQVNIATHSDYEWDLLRVAHYLGSNVYILPGLFL